MNDAAVGKSYPPIPLVVDPDRVGRFAEVIDADGVPGVPPTFVTAWEFAIFPEIVDDPDLGLDFSRVLHGEQRYEWRRPLALGETLTVTAHVAQIRQRGPLGFCTIASLLRDAEGELVALGRCTFVERGAGTGSPARADT